MMQGAFTVQISLFEQDHLELLDDVLPRNRNNKDYSMPRSKKWRHASGWISKTIQISVCSVLLFLLSEPEDLLQLPCPSPHCMLGVRRAENFLLHRPLDPGAPAGHLHQKTHLRSLNGTWNQFGNTLDFKPGPKRGKTLGGERSESDLGKRGE